MTLIRIVLCLMLLPLPGMAHVGMESSSEVRLYPDRLQLVVRTSYPLAWKFLGSRAPAGDGEAERAVAGPLLGELAAGLFEVTQGGQAMSPTRTDCRFELDQDVAFVLIYPRPLRWPVGFHARYLKWLGPLDSGTIAFFDQTMSPRVLLTEPGSGMVLMQGKETFTIDPNGATRTPETVATVAENPGSARGKSHVWLIGFLLGGIALTGLGYWFRANLRRKV